MEVHNRIDHALQLPLDWDNQAMAGNNPPAVLDFLQGQFPDARFRKAHAKIVGSVNFRKSEKGRALLFVTNNSQNLLHVDGQKPFNPTKGTLVIIPEGKAVLEHTYQKRLVIEYSL